MTVLGVQMISFGVLIVLSVGALQTMHAACPFGWLAWQDACYIWLPDKMNWWQASRVCDGLRSSLVVPDSQEEQDFIWQQTQELIKGLSASNLQLWIGCKKRDGTDELVCPGHNGAPTFTFWASVKAATGTDDPCVRMKGYQDGKWDDTDCNNEFYAACEMLVSLRSYCLQANADGQVTPQFLFHHEIKNLTVTGVIGCGQACWAEPRCHSFNLWHNDEDKNVCQLNSATSLEADVTDFQYTSNCQFFELCPQLCFRRYSSPVFSKRHILQQSSQEL